MDKYDVLAQIVDVLKARGLKPKRSGEGYSMRCPVHDDANPSAWVNHDGWGCHGCGVRGGVFALAKELGIETPPPGFTAKELADRKGFSMDVMQRFGVEDVNPNGRGVVVAFPYRRKNGTTHRVKYRHRSGTFWDDQKGVDLIPYNLDGLAKAPESDPVILVEGETDCIAAAHHDVVAIGLPGAGTWRSSWVEGLRRALKQRPLYVWQEPGPAAEKLVRDIAESLPEARVIKAPENIKDLAELHKQAKEQFFAQLTALMGDARAITAPDVPAPPGRFESETRDSALRAIEEKTQPIDVLVTPLPSWNSACRGKGGGEGLARGWYVIVAGATGHGKTLVACNVVADATAHGERVCFLSLEMEPEDLYTRLDAIDSGHDIRSLEQGASFDLSLAKRVRLTRLQRMRQAGGALFVNRDELNDLDHIEEAVRYHVEQRKCRVVVVDYLQLAWVEGSRDLLPRITEVSHRLRRLTRELQITTIGLSQLNRESSKDFENPPTAQSLFGGSPLENDSTQVLLLDHTTYEENHDARTATTRLILDKNRHGPSRTIKLSWDYRSMRMEETALGLATTAPAPAPQLALVDDDGKPRDWQRASAGDAAE